MGQSNNGNNNSLNGFNLGDRIRVISPSGTSRGFFIAFQGELLIWGRAGCNEARLALTNLTTTTVERF